jgi:signal transduction histidine kinase/HPt (histidine-containing phosphotransfer) domain-containing protein
MPSENQIKLIRAVLIEGNPGDVRLMREMLLSARNLRFEIECFDRLASGLERLRQPGIDVVLLDLSLPDSQGMDTIARVHAEGTEVPIVALSGTDDDRIMQDTLKHGAEDYLVKGTFGTEILVRTIRFAIECRQLREELARARVAALETAQARSEFLANLSHEIRTSLNGLLGMTSLLGNMPLSVDQQATMAIARSSANTLLKIVNDLLDFSKISAGKVVLAEVDFDLWTAIETVMDIFTVQARDKGAVLDSFIESEVQTRLRGDAGRLCQVLTNLIGNALEFTSNGSIKAHIQCVGGDAGQSILRFEVRDTGIGIALDSRRNIFQAFAQADSSITWRGGGAGLGLTISAQLVELMGGRIGLESEPGRGSTYWFTAMFAHQPAAMVADCNSGLMAEETESRSQPSPPSRTAGQIASMLPAEIRQRIQILMVEDNLVNQRVGIRMLDRIGYQAETAVNGRVALEKLAIAGFDIILMDCQMPEMDGYQATREIRRREGAARHTPIIGVTARALPGDREECLRAGMDECIAKPILLKDLAAIIDKWANLANPPLGPSAILHPAPRDAGAQSPGSRVQTSAIPVLDQAVLADLRGYQNPGEPDFVTELIGIFGKDLTGRLTQIRSGLETGDAKRIYQAAHALKSACGELGAERMREICGRLALCTAEGSLGAAAPIAHELEDEAVEVRAALASNCV